MSATTRVQFLDYNLIRSGQFSVLELGMLEVIYSFSEYSQITMQNLGRAIQRSERTARRLVNGLVRKGIITKQYTFYKKCRLQIIPLAEQAKLKGIGMVKAVIKTVKKTIKNPMKSSYRTPVTDPDRTFMTDSIRSKTLEEKQINIELKPRVINIEETKRQALLKFALYLKS